jgi:hypothetical protein
MYDTFIESFRIAPIYFGKHTENLSGVVAKWTVKKVTQTSINNQKKH